jgi:uncharacterized protein
MLLEVDKLESSWLPVTFAGTLEDPEFADEISLTGPVSLQGEIRRKDDRVQFRGEVSTRGNIECSRCLDPVAVDITAPFEVSYAAALADDDGDLEVEDEDLSVVELTGNTIDLKDFAREQVLLNVPARMLCREDCQGLCEICGANKNLSPCGCESETIDPRWQALKGLVGS